MKQFDFSAEELSELEALQVRGGAAGNPASPMGQDGCINESLGCGSGPDQKACVNRAVGCGSILHIGCTIVPVHKDCLGPENPNLGCG